MYNNSASPMSLVCNPSHNVTSPTDLSNNSPSLNDHKIPFLWTSSRNFLSQIRYSLVVILELNGVSEVQYEDVMMIDDGKYQ